MPGRRIDRLIINSPHEKLGEYRRARYVKVVEWFDEDH